MIQHKKTNETKFSILSCKRITERKRIRRALEVDEIRHLLETTKTEPYRFGMSGTERSLLYWMAMETGLRASELKSLNVLSFDFENQQIKIEAAYAKNKKTETLPLNTKTVALLREWTAGKMPMTKVFNMPDKTAKMLRKDLKAAGIPYIDGAGRYADFHSLRHTFGTLLAASGAKPKESQTLMRHSDINLTMSRYTHTLRGQESQAIENLPDLSQPSSSQKEKTVRTGTDNLDIETTQPKNLACFLALQDGQERTSADNGGQDNRIDDKKNEVFNGRCRNRTCDPLIKSQLLYRLS